MKKKILRMMALLLFMMLIQNGFATTRKDVISGPTSVCYNTTHEYEVVMENCFISILDIDVSSNGTIVNGPFFPTSNNRFTVNWTNNGNTNTTGTINVLVDYFEGNCPSITGPIPPSSQKWISLNVTIAPQNISVNNPAAISSSFRYTQSSITLQANSYYQFLTSASNVDGINWQIVNGGTIYRNNGDNIDVKANNGSCSITVRARSRKKNCAGVNKYSNWVSTTYDITPPSTPGIISGYELVPGSTHLYEITAVPRAAEYSWRIDNSDFQIYGMKLNGIPNPSTGIKTFVSAPSDPSVGTLYVRAKNSCGQSPGEGSRKFITLGFPSIANSSEEADMIFYPNPVKENRTLTVFNEKQSKEYKVEIINENGEILKSYVLSNQREILFLDDLESGTYFLKYGDSSKEVKRFIIK